MDNELTETLDLRAYWGLLRHWAWLLILATILGGAIGYVVSKQITPVYQASTRLLINEANAGQGTDYTSILTSERLAQTYAEMMTATPILAGVVDALELPVLAESLKGAVEVSLVRDTQLIDVAVTHTDPATAAAIANKLVEVFVAHTQTLEASRYAASKDSLAAQMTEMSAQITTTSEAIAALSTSVEDEADRLRLETTLAQYRQVYANLLTSYESIRLAEAQSVSNLTPVEPAVTPASPIRPQVSRNALLAAVIGLMLAVGLIFLIETLDDTLRDPEMIEKKIGLPILGFIEHVEHTPAGMVCAEDPRSLPAERYRSLRTNIQYTQVDKPIRSLMVTSASPEDGKSTTALNLATVMAQSGRKVVLVDADLRRPNIHRLVGMANGKGLSELFIDPDVHLNGHLKRSGVRGLAFLTTGALPPNPSELLNSARMDKILESLKEIADLVIVDCPPITAVTDAAVLAPRLDAILLVVKPGTTKQAAFQQAVEQFQRLRANMIGVVLNDLKVRQSRYGHHYYGKYAYNDEGYQVYDNTAHHHRKSRQPAVEKRASGE